AGAAVRRGVRGGAGPVRRLPGRGEAAAVTRVLVADDQPLIRSGFRQLVDSAPAFRTVGEASTGAEAVELAARHRPDLVLMDVRMPVMDGIEATRRICAARPATRVLIVTTFDLDEYVYGALQAGAAGFLLKDTP